MSVDQPAARPRRRSGESGRMLQRVFMRIHSGLYRLTGGVIGGRAGSRSFLLLTTTGRKSGQQRVTPIFYLPDGDNFVLIASNWGAPTHSIWWLNLQAHPQAWVQVGRKILPVIARQADPAERARLWSLVTAKYANFAAYQQRTTREIPVVILTPAS
ncbi:MAG TPA: nitroreductase family deazaflavin-dependent oxidoreductase [Ktedonosporobacter sp.]|nr:nitroreductase family deazaflavin-dependent oxidoreductase [Ktedonosporobacter sp.]